MAEYIDAIFDNSNSTVCDVYEDADAVVLAIKNLLLTRPGNYPENPQFGMNIRKYQFEELDDDTINSIKSELSYQINKFIPVVDTTNIEVTKFLKSNGDEFNGIGVYVSVNINGDISDCHMLIMKENEEISTIVDVSK